MLLSFTNDRTQGFFSELESLFSSKHFKELIRNNELRKTLGAKQSSLLLLQKGFSPSALAHDKSKYLAFMSQLFLLLDLNGDGKLETAEFEKLEELLGRKALGVFRQIDLNQNGYTKKLEYENFVAIMWDAIRQSYGIDLSNEQKAQFVQLERNEEQPLRSHLELQFVSLPGF